ncbi:hypothetical protein K443DRAFT_385998 [Laccaria amethystina LaAM-08-1]|uniref:Pseudouridine synthase RsuA/RluA-like domain-containing protein n=1 Tax=Laccaria amethystina LaAM-08-1 TaxID=1095629 RepID=A0A0C9YGC5_9AGAR|nr:hypothetical protein K443DRAFT_385998 [Laccaria amethystina LaAM-08-1]
MSLLRSTQVRNPLLRRVLFSRNAARWVKSLLYVDPAVVVVTKPHDLVCQLIHHKLPAGRVNHFNVMMEDLKAHLSLKTFPYSVHRLDKGTTGALLLALTQSSARQISQQFQKRTVQKTYLALVRGGEKSFPEAFGEIRTSLKTVDGYPEVDLSLQGQPCATDWKLLASSPIAPVSLLELNLLTGYKHQLRVHLAKCLHAPILGDAQYSKKPLSSAITDVVKIPEDRIFLHASEISFFKYKSSGPHKQFRLAVRAPLPREFLKLCKDLKIPLRTADILGGMAIDGEPTKEDSIAEVNGRWVHKIYPTQKKAIGYMENYTSQT